MADEESINPALKKLKEVLFVAMDRGALSADLIAQEILDAGLIILTEEQRDELFGIDEAKNTQAVSQDYLDYQEVELRKFAIEKAYAAHLVHPIDSAELILEFLKTGEAPHD